MKTVVGGMMATLVVALCSVASAAEVRPAGASFGGASCAIAPGATSRGVAVASMQAVGGRAAASRVRPAAQVTRNEKADVTFELRQSADGGAEVSAGSGSLQVTKTVASTGDFRLQLKTDRDMVTIDVSGKGTRVHRGRAVVDLSRQRPVQARQAEARRLLAESDAVLQYRGLADALIAADDRSPSAMAIIIGDAVLGVLAGDVGATRRTAQFLARVGDRNRRPVGMAIDCFTLMETRMMEAWNDYGTCWISVSSNPFASLYEQMCAYRWVVQVESYWFSFVSCSGLNL